MEHNTRILNPFATISRKGPRIARLCEQLSDEVHTIRTDRYATTQGYVAELTSDEKTTEAIETDCELRTLLGIR